MYLELTLVNSHELDQDFKALMDDRKLKERERLEELTRIRVQLEKLERTQRERYERGWHWI